MGAEAQAHPLPAMKLARLGGSATQPIGHGTPNRATIAFFWIIHCCTSPRLTLTTNYLEPLLRAIL
jgi:hypothetical protein